jgi:CMP-N-acetylneuraminic acid synthetase
MEIKNKNIKILFGKPLILHTVDLACKIKIFNKIVVTSDSKKILNICKKKSNLLIHRPKRLSNNSISKIQVIKHALKYSEKKFKTNFDTICDLDVTSPLRLKSDVYKAFKIFKRKKPDNLISVNESHKNPYFNMVEKKNGKLKLVKENKRRYYSRQKAPSVFEVNASIYIWKRKALLKNKNIVNANTEMLVMPKYRSVDIDSEFDFKLIKALKEVK